MQHYPSNFSLCIGLTCRCTTDVLPVYASFLASSASYEVLEDELLYKGIDHSLLSHIRQAKLFLYFLNY